MTVNRRKARLLEEKLEKESYDEIVKMKASRLVDKMLEESGLPEWVQDLAFDLATKNRSQRDWARVYRVHWGTLTKWYHHPQVKALVRAIKGSIRDYRVGAERRLQRMAIEQYMRIFDMADTQWTIEVKRKCALDIMQWSRGSEPVPDTQAIINQQFNLNGSKPSEPDMRNVTPGAAVEVLEQELDEIKRLEGQVDGDYHERTAS